MNKPKLDVAQLRKQEPSAWTALLRAAIEEEVVVTAVKATSLRTFPRGSEHRMVRYYLTLKGHSDPITFVGKRTNRQEFAFYQNIAFQIPYLAPRCFFASLSGDEGWVVIQDVPNHFPPQTWKQSNVESVINGLTKLHEVYWNQEELLKKAGIPTFFGEKKFTWQGLRKEFDVYFEEGPAADLSEHAIHHAGSLAPLFLKAANGLAVIRSLGGWPGVLGESHLSAVADLLDDPVPVLEPLRNLPLTLMHGDPSSYHWRLTLFDELRLFDWQKAAFGPGILDLVNFLEQFDLIYDTPPGDIQMRQDRPVSEETMIDGYLLSMSSKLGPQFNARVVRQAIPAARCLYILTNWLPQFADWFSKMPSKYTWQKVNRMRDDQLVGSVFQPLSRLRPYLATVFIRFLQAYRTL